MAPDSSQLDQAERLLRELGRIAVRFPDILREQSGILRDLDRDDAAADFQHKGIQAATILVNESNALKARGEDVSQVRRWLDEASRAGDEGSGGDLVNYLNAALTTLRGI